MTRLRSTCRAIGLILVTSALAAQTAHAGGTATSDDFNRVNLDVSRWTLVNPLDDGQVAMIGAGTGDAHMALTLPAGTPHDAWGNGSLRVMQPSSDTDFELEIKFNYEPTGGFNDQGLIVEADGSNWLRFDVFHDGHSLRAFIGSTIADVNTSVAVQNVPPGNATHLRVGRTADTFQFAVSGDGNNWIPAGSVTQPLAVARVGVYAANPSQALPFTSEVDYFFNTASPIQPEDAGPAPVDVDAPLVHAHDRAPGLGQFTVQWFTDEPSIGTIEYGTTLAYELGSISDAGGLYAHSITVPGLQSDVTYHYRLSASDGINAPTVSDDVEVLLNTVGPVFHIWYGATQNFGTVGVPQPWVNILGNVSDLDGIANLSYSLNGGNSVPLTVGPDGRRLENDGDFNIDLATGQLLSGPNSVQITAVDNARNTSVSNVMVHYTPGNLWPLPYSIDWSLASKIEDVAQVVDGLWSLEGIGVRTAEPGYDRLIDIGQATWDDYEVVVPIQLNDLSNPGGGVGVVMRWNGNSDYPIAGTQPKSGYFPLGCIGWYRNGRLELFGNQGVILGSTPMVLTQGQTYLFKLRVEDGVGSGSAYKLKVWNQAAAEPLGWNVEGESASAHPQFGSACLISHLFDATFGNPHFTPIAGPPNTSPLANSDSFYVAPGGLTAVDALLNDEDSDGVLVPATLNITVFPLHGFLTVHPTTGVVSYTHDGSATTTDEFRYTVRDNDGAVSNEAVVAVQITNTPPLPFESDDFNCGLDTKRWTFVNPLQDGSFAFNDDGSGGTQLELSLPAGVRHDAWGPAGLNESARLMQDSLNLDFEILAEWKSEPTDGYNDQGILVEATPNHWLRFDVFHTGSVLRAFVGKTVFGSNITLYSARVLVGTTRFMRVSRTGNEFRFEISDNGTNWSLVHVHTHAMVVQSVGVYAANPRFGLPFTAKCDYFFETRAPIEPEDGVSCVASTLVLDVEDCQTDLDASPGLQIAVQLRVRDLQELCDGYQAFVDYDMGALSYRGDLSSYNPSVFQTHNSPILQADDGLVELDGNQVSGTTDDLLLATLVFDVAMQCDNSGTLDFAVGGPSTSELRLLGAPIATDLQGPSSYRFDTIPPMIVGVPNISTAADAGSGSGCLGAIVPFDAPLATDNCTALPLVICTPASGSVFPIGTTQVICVATDDCGNSSQSSFEVEVRPTNIASVMIELEGVSGPVTRCIHLATDSCTSVDLELEFVGTPATFIGDIELPCGGALALSAKDEQHTLCDSTSLGLSVDGARFVANSTLVLRAGDTDNNGVIDIDDLTWFYANFGLFAQSGGCAWDGVTRDSDFDNDGAVTSADYVFLSMNWLESTHCGCVLPYTEGPQAPDIAGVRSRSKLQRATAELPPSLRARLDRDGDGVFDYKDVRQLERLHRLPADLSGKLERASRERANTKR